jgi:hypothetical protein
MHKEPEYPQRCASARQSSNVANGARPASISSWRSDCRCQFQRPSESFLKSHTSDTVALTSILQDYAVGVPIRRGVRY